MRTNLALFLLLMFSGLAASANAQSFTAYLTPAQEVPATASSASGYCRVLVNPTTLSYTFTVKFTGLTSAQTASHIHSPAAIGSTAAVSINFGVVGGTSGTITGSGTMTAQNLADIKSHLAYVNVHSTNFPNGEIRGQLGLNRPVDYDGDGRTDYSVLRFPGSAPDTITYYNLNSSASTFGGGLNNIVFGDADQDFPSPGDYDGDGKDDIALFRGGGGTAGSPTVFWIFRSSDNVAQSFVFGVAGDQACSRDFDGDGKTDPAVFRRGANPGDQAYFFARRSTDGNTLYVPFGTTGATDGSTGDTPVVGDYDGDGKADFAVYRFGGLTPNNTFIVLHSSDLSVTYQPFGNFTTDYVVPGDYDGDGKIDYAVARTGALSSTPMAWYMLLSSNGSLRAGQRFGISSDVPAQGDYDGDGRTDVAVYRAGASATAQSNFYVSRSFDGGTSFVAWGLGSDFAANTFDAR